MAVRDDATGRISEPLLMRTAAADARHSIAWRASEYTFDVDFLQVGERLFCAIRLSKLTLCQGRLGTNIGKPQKTNVFSQNHDAADRRTLALYIQQSGAINETCYSGFAPGAAHCNSRGGQCIEKLQSVCAAERGNGFDCMRCADSHRAELLRYENASFAPFYTKNDRFTKAGSGQT